MSQSCTISEIPSIISQNLKRSPDHDHAHLREYLLIQRLILHMSNQCRKLEVSSINCFIDILGGGLKIKMGHVTRPRPFQGQYNISEMVQDRDIVTMED